MNDELRPAELHVVLPGIVQREREAGAIALYNPGHGTSLEVEAESRPLVHSVLTGFAQPTRLDAFLRAHPEVPVDLLELMVRSGFVVEVSELAFLEHGFLKPVPNPLGAACTWSDLPDIARLNAWAVVGVPMDMAAGGTGGARHGPSEIRKVVNGALLSDEGDVVDYDFKRLYRDFAPSLLDLGDVEPDGARLDYVGARLRKVIAEILAHDMRPLVLGGDHSITYFVLAELCARGKPFGIVHFDAHADLEPSRALSHASVFRAALEAPCVTEVLQIGLRGVERITPFAERVACPKRKIITAREANAGLAQRALEALPRDIPYYLTFDIDCVDPAVARETGTPLFGGLSFELATELVDLLSRTRTLLGADFVEVGGPVSGLNGAALIAANLLQRCVLGDSPFEPLSTDYYVL